MTSILQPANPVRQLALPDGRDIELLLRRSARARHVMLRIDDANGEVELVLPRRAAICDGLAFADSKAGWIAARLNALPPTVPFRPGSVLPVLGDSIALMRPLNGAKRVRRSGGALQVPGDGDAFAGRVRRWLIAEARREIGARAHRLALEVERPIKRLAIRDPATRWGSCSAAGGLSFSWRLILAPPEVLDYVVAHEIAHLRHMNHGRRFWSLVEKMAGDCSAHRTWLRRNGTLLRRYG
ncbi:MAG: M48 family metallopeptidase [Rhodospirillaceae bacterium]|nr:M48 family metallopeptidase [Rhodospirillaceae bacterium]